MLALRNDTVLYDNLQDALVIHHCAVTIPNVVKTLGIIPLIFVSRSNHLFMMVQRCYDKQRFGVILLIDKVIIGEYCNINTFLFYICN